MIKNYFNFIGIIGLSVLFFGGCSTYAPFKHSTFGADPLIEMDSFQEIDLVRLLDPSSTVEQKDYTSKTLEEAFDKFYEETDLEKRKLNRNRIQERILAASQERCEEYVQYLDKKDSHTNFALGGLTTLVGGVGAILTPASTVRALSGAAAILSGTRAEFNESYFANKTIEVVRKGIEAKRKGLYTAMKTNQNSALKDYTVEAAIKDAVAFHGACSLSGGLEHLADSLQRAENPGLKGAQNTLELVQHLRETMDNGNVALVISGLEGPIKVGNTQEVTGKTGGDFSILTPGDKNIATVIVGPTSRTATIKGISPGKTTYVLQNLGKRTYKLEITVENEFDLKNIPDLTIGMDNGGHGLAIPLGVDQKRKVVSSDELILRENPAQTNTTQTTLEPLSPGKVLVTITNEKGNQAAQFVTVKNGFPLNKINDLKVGKNNDIAMSNANSKRKVKSTDEHILGADNSDSAKITLIPKTPGKVIVTINNDDDKKAAQIVNVENEISLSSTNVKVSTGKPATVILKTGTTLKNVISADKNVADVTFKAGDNTFTIDPGTTKDKTFVTVEDSSNKKGGILVTME